MKIKLSLFIVLLLIVSVFTTVLAEGQIAKQVVIGRNEDSYDLDPITQNENSDIWLFTLFLEGLVQASDDGKSIGPCLAESWDISEDKLTFTFKLKPGVKFSDGTPVTVEDWVWSLLRARDTEESLWKFSLECLEDVTAPDDNTLVLKIKEPWAPLLADLAMFNATVQKKAYFESVSHEEYSKKSIGTGPYRIKEWKIGEYILFEENPYYRKEGLPKTEEIKFVLVPDDNTRLLQLMAGQLDIATFVPFNKMKELDDDPRLVAYGIPSTMTRHITFSHIKKPLDNLKVRLALDYGIDKQELVDYILFGYGEVAISLFPSAGIFLNDSLKDRGYDPEKAKALLTEAGYPDGLELEFLVASGITEAEQMSIILKERLKKIGVTLNILTLEKGLENVLHKTGNFEIETRYWCNDTIDPSQQCEYAFLPENTCLSTRWGSTERAIELVQQGKREMDPEKREQIYFELQKIWYDNVPYLPAFEVPFPVAMWKNIEGFVQTPLGGYKLENLVKHLE